MKPTYALLSDFSTATTPFLVKEIVRASFSPDFHFHDECQLVYIVSGSGTRIIGGSIEHFEPGDLTFVGSNVPHVWYSEPNPDDKEAPAISLALYINPSKLTTQLKGLIDTQSIEDFFVESERGMSIVGSKKQLIYRCLKLMLKQKSVGLLIYLFQILEMLMEPSERTWLNSTNIISSVRDHHQHRVSRLMQYIQKHFREEISLEQAAEVAGMQRHSFCRFFKQITKHTFSDFLNRVRVAFAAQLLQHSELPITQIVFESGFNNISYFNRTFKKIYGQTPKELRAKILGK